MSQEKLAKLVSNEVYYCVSELMWRVSQDMEKSSSLFDEDYDNVLNLFSKSDWETPAFDGGWKIRDGQIFRTVNTLDPDEDSTLYADSWEDACDQDQIEADYVAAYEHWIVSQWLAEKLKEKGEIVGKFAGLTIWGRTTTGQAICMDWVISEIYRDLQKG